jgi:quercetin dioxygenase-like cupin family protein
VTNPFGRRVVTGPGGVVSDGPSALTIDVPGAAAVSELAWFEGSISDPEAPFEREGRGFPLEPPPGGVSARIIRFPPGDWITVPNDAGEAVSLHATDTLDFVVVLEGEIVLGTADGSEVTLGPGDTVIQRGAWHRWRVPGPTPCTYFVAMLRPDPSRPAPPPLLGFGEGGTGVRRVVTAGGELRDGFAVQEFTAPTVRMVDLWHTGGPLTDVLQGGEYEQRPFTLEPPPGGAWFRTIELFPGPRNDAGWHQTATVDVDIVLSGRLGLDLPDGVTVELGPGDAVVQRGTDHRWYVLGDEPVRFAAVMLSAVPS